MRVASTIFAGVFLFSCSLVEPSDGLSEIWSVREQVDAVDFSVTTLGGVDGSRFYAM